MILDLRLSFDESDEEEEDKIEELMKSVRKEWSGKRGGGGGKSEGREMKFLEY